MIIGITGHANLETPFGVEYNPNEYDPIIFNRVFNDLESFLKSKGRVTCCLGMARGVDEIFALAAIKLGLDLILCIPKNIDWHKNLNVHEARGRAQAINYQHILDYKNIKTIIEVEKTIDQNVFNDRNQVIVNSSDSLFSYHLFESIGTMDCIRRGKLNNIYMGNLYKKII